MQKSLIPDGMLKNIYGVTPARLAKKHKKAVIFDIDNTVAPYEIATPTEKMKQYFALLTESGVEVAFVSNNKSERADVFNTELGFFCVPDAGKPSPDGILKCVSHFGIPKQNILLVGDQIFTDCLAAHRAGIECWLVTPISGKENLFFKIKRLFERKYIDEYKRRNKERKAVKRAERLDAKKQRIQKRQAKKQIGKHKFRAGR